MLAIWTLLAWVATIISTARRKGQRPMPYDPALTFKKVPLVSSPLGANSANNVEDFDRSTRTGKTPEFQEIAARNVRGHTTPPS